MSATRRSPARRPAPRRQGPVEVVMQLDVPLLVSGNLLTFRVEEVFTLADIRPTDRDDMSVSIPVTLIGRDCMLDVPVPFGRIARAAARSGKRRVVASGTTPLATIDSPIQLTVVMPEQKAPIINNEIIVKREPANKRVELVRDNLGALKGANVKALP